MNFELSGLTNSARALWDELLERRLWPVAVALVVAIVAVPVLLHKSASTPVPPPAPPAAGGTGSLAAFTPAVSTEGRKSSEIRKNLRSFKAKNPFTPQGLNLSSGSAGTAQPLASATSGGGTSTPAGGGLAGSGSSGTTTPTGSSGTPTTTPQTGTTGTGVTKYYTWTVQVKFGKEGEEETRKLTEFRALPSSTNPVVIFMGVRPDGEEAVFLIGTDASTTGDGKCRPSEDQCTFLYLNVHDKRTIEATDADGGITDYSLELTDIGVKETDGPTTAQSRSDRIATRKARQAHLLTVSRNLQSLGL